jgi:ATP-dependent DNA ligase
MKDKKMKITHNQASKAIIPELRGSLGSMTYPCFAEIKYDGEATIISYDETWPDKIITTNKYGTMRSEWSKLDIITGILEEKGVTKAMFLGELFYGNGEAGALYELLSRKDDNDLNLKIYDIINLNNKVDMSGNASLIDRKEILTELFFGTPFLVESKVINSKEEALEYFEEITTLQWEGIVLKGFDGRLVIGPCGWVKLKKKDQNNYEVTFIDQIRERIEVKVPLPVPANTLALIQKYISVGCKCANKHKKNLKVGDIVVIEHQGVLDSGSLRHPVYIGKVQEKGE